MRILVICQYYYPEPFRISDICEELVKRGHEVFVVTGVPNYPMGEIYDGYRHGEKRDEFINGVKVHRCYTVGRKGGILKRFLNYFSYPISASAYVNLLKDEYDVVFVNQLSPVMMAWPAIRYKKKHDKKVAMYCLDLWPASLRAGAMSDGTFIYGLFHHVSAKIYRQMDLILNTSRSFEEYQIGELKIDKTKIQYEDFFAVPKDYTCLGRKINLVHVANNVKNSVKGHDVVIQVVKKLNDAGIDAQVVFVGDGEKRKEFEQMAGSLGIGDKVSFTGLLPSPKDVREILLNSDLLIFPTKCEGLPRVVIEAMAVGLPCLSTPVNGIPELLEKEYMFDPLDVDGFVKKIIDLLDDPQQLNQMSKRNIEKAREYESSIQEQGSQGTGLE